MKTTEQYIWAIAYIDVSTVNRIERDLKKSNQYSLIEAHVPMVQILKKKFKGQEHFDQVPLLFHYGFFKIPLLYAMNLDLLNQLKSDITCISHWVEDRARFGTKPSRFIEEDDEYIYLTKTQEYFDTIRPVICATCRESEVLEMVRYAEEESIHSSEDINKLRVGDIVKLMGYPFDDTQAQVEEIDLKRRKVTVVLNLTMDEEGDDDEPVYGGNPIVVSFDNVFYSIYRSQSQYDEEYSPSKEKSMTEKSEKSQYHEDK